MSPLAGRTPAPGGAGRLAPFTRLAAVTLVAGYAGLALLAVRDAVSLAASAAALVVLTLAVGAAVLPPPRPLGRPQLLGVAAAPAVMALLLSWGLPTQAPGHTAWHLGACTLVLFFVAARGHVAAAWAGLGGLAAVTAVWALTAGVPASRTAHLLVTHVLELLVGTGAGVAYRRTEAATTALLAADRQRSVTRARAAAAQEERERRLARLEAQARPVLERLAAGWAPGPEALAEVRAVEAGIRDRIRAPRLDVPALEGAVAAARRRGVEVVLMDDGAADPLPAALVDALTRFVAGAGDGRVVVRLLPPGRGAEATVLVASSAGTSVRALTADGRPAPTSAALSIVGRSPMNRA